MVTASGQPAGEAPLKIGVLTDMSSLFADIGGQGSVTALRMAVEDFGGQVLGKPIEVVSADHQNKTDVAANKAREWFDVQGVDMITDLLPSSVALAVSDVGRQKNKVVIVNGGGSSKLTGEACSPNTVHYAYDTYALSTNTVNALLAQGLDSWFFLTVDYALGHSLEGDAVGAVKAGNGKVVGTARHPVNASDLASYLLQAQGSRAKVVALADAGGDFVNAVKQAGEFGLRKSGRQTLAGLHVFISDIHSLGLAQAQGMVLTTGFYWDQNEATRAWSRRFHEKTRRMPTMVQAGVYSSTMHYLKAVQASGTKDPQTVLARMRETPINDFFATNGRIQANGRMVHDMLLVEVKKPSQAREPWDYYRIKAVIPGASAFIAQEKSGCKL
ncbi:leucine ABC transporter subunit substrate-binding protein LivK [Delftia tsuruhatensis]|nr:ABC transporter substrate-binding protein [Delftia tsuruhatensis]CAB5695058.1 leucine ABC transporter subunit substrate-binding protein LivK [Delftia tsuruhatensis]CAC9687018.1 leucine ABC transporter subunit substrate-binding protein LivK [Delftia tsuruhatensis]